MQDPTSSDAVMAGSNDADIASLLSANMILLEDDHDAVKHVFVSLRCNTTVAVGSGTPKLRPVIAMCPSPPHAGALRADVQLSAGASKDNRFNPVPAIEVIVVVPWLLLMR